MKLTTCLISEFLPHTVCGRKFGSKARTQNKAHISFLLKVDIENSHSFHSLFVLVCKTCNKVYAICCPIHSTYNSTDSALEVDWDSYAIKSFPDVVQLCKSSIPGKTYGVCARQHIPVGTWIGPYEGRKIAPDAINQNVDSSYLWEV